MSELIKCVDNLTTKDIIRRVAKTANGVPFYINTLGLGGFCTQFQAVLDAYVGTIPNAIQLAAQNTMACGLYEDGVWDKIDVFWPLANGDSPNCDLNWINPGTFTLTPINAPLFTPWEGYLGNGTDEYLDTNWKLRSDGINYTQNDASVGVYCRTQSRQTKYAFGVTSGSSVYAQLYNTGNNVRSMLNNAVNLDIANADSRGLFIFTRNASGVPSARIVYKNKVAIGNDATASGLPPDINMFILARNSGGIPDNHCTQQISMLFAGSNFTQADVDNMTDRFETYMDSNGKGVIP